MKTSPGRYITTPEHQLRPRRHQRRELGHVLNAQQFNNDFMRDFFASTKGARWKMPGSPGGCGGLDYLGDSVDAYRADLPDQVQGRAGIVERADRALSGAEHDAARVARGRARPDARRGRHAEVPGAGGRAGQQRRLLGSRERLQPLSRRARDASTSCRTTRTRRSPMIADRARVGAASAVVVVGVVV